MCGRRKRRALKPAAALVGLLLGLPPSGWAAEAARPARAAVGGVVVELAVEPVSGPELREQGDARVRFKIADAATGTPLAGLAPAAWIDPLKEGQGAASACSDSVEQFLSGSLFRQPAVDLNTYHVLALNDDATISVINPLLGFGGTKLLALLSLASPGEDWALSPDGSRLFVSQPEAGRVAVIDTAAWKVLANLEVGPRAGRLALQPDGTALWAAFSGGVAAIDTAASQVVARLPTGAGPHDLALSGDGRRLFVSNRDGRSLTAIDTARREVLKEVPLGTAPTAVTFSPAAGAAYAVSESDGKIVAVDAARLEVAAVLEAQPGLAALRFAPGGRLGFAPNPKTNGLSIVDATRNRIVQTTEMLAGPDQVTFSETLAYVRHRGTETVLMIPLDQVGVEGRQVPVADFPGGQNPPGKTPLPSPADSILRVPGGGAMLVANPTDGALYYYKEGMAAPMGSFQNYGRAPRAVLVVDRSLRERSPGTYETVARLGAAGRQRVAFFLDAPRTVHCFEVTVATDPALAERRSREGRLAVQAALDSRTVTAGRPARFRFRLSHAATDEPWDGLADVEMLVYSAAGTWKSRRPARSVGAGLYEAELLLPEEGSYNLAVECLSQGLPFHRSPQVALQAVRGPVTPSP